jgi:hypothetical protein
LPTQYAISGWFKWKPIPNQQTWHNAFRVSAFKNPGNLESLGDRDLACWVGTPGGGQYYFASYTYTNLNCQGNPNVYDAIPYTYYLPLWHYIYMGYSRDLRNVFFYVQYRDAAYSKNLATLNHYLTPNFQVSIGGDKIHASYSGTLAYMNFNAGPGAYRTTFAGLNADND